MVQFLPLLLTHSIRLYMAIPSICRTVLTDLVLKSNIHWLCNERSFTSLKDIKSWNRIIRKGLKKNHQTHQTLSKKKSKHVKSIQVIHVYITVQIWVFGPILHSHVFCNSAWHSWWRHARWHAWHSWRYHTPEAISNGAAVVWIKGKFQNTTQPFLGAHGPRLGSLQDLQRWKFSSKKNVTTYLP